MAISPVKQGSGGANLDAVATLGTIQPATVRSDYGVSTAVAGFDCLFTHPFVTDARAALAQDATLRIVCHHRRQVFFRMVVLLFREALFEIAPVESQLLQFAFATPITHGTIKRMVSE